MTSNQFGIAAIAPIFAGILLGISSAPAAAVPTPSCTLTGQSLSAVEELVPQGCEYVLTNGPVTFSGVVGTGGGNTHDITINELDIWRNSSNNYVAFVAFSNTKNTVPPTTDSQTFFLNLSETDTTQSTAPILDNATTNFAFSSFLLTQLGTSGAIQLDPGSMASDTGSDTLTDLGGGGFRISSFFDVFVDLSLDGTFGGTTGGLPNSVGPSDLRFALVNRVPEPITLSIFGTGLAGAIVMRRRKVKG